MLSNLPERIKNFLAGLSYSFKVKIVIAFSSMLSVFAVISILKLQEPFEESLSKQSKATALYSAWIESALRLMDVSSNPTEENYALFSTRHDELQIKAKNIFQNYESLRLPTELKLSAYIGEIRQLGVEAYMQAIPMQQLIEKIESMNRSIAHVLINELKVPLGDDLPTYLLSDMIYHDLVGTQTQTVPPLLLSILHNIPEHLLAGTPGKLLDEAHTSKKMSQHPEGLKDKLCLIKHLNQTLSNILEAQHFTMHLRQWMSILCVFLGLLIVVTVYSTRVMRTPLADLRFAAQQIAHGNLWHRAIVDSSDEVAKMCAGFNSMATLLEKAVTSTSVVSNKLTDTMGTLGNSAKLFEQNAIEQEQTVVKIAQNTVGIIQTSKDVVLALEEALLVATVTHEFAISAQDSIRVIQETLSGIAAAAQQIVQTLSILEERVAGLNAIINTIVTVADEANLLSINTALISQSSRHRSSGFGVIATKISELASQTAFVTLKMEDSVKGILNALSKAGMQIHHLSHQLHSHSEAASHLVERFIDMKRKATEQHESCERMRSAIKHQEKSAEQIHDTITLLSQGAKITTRSVRNLYSQIRYLGEASSNLQIIFERFHLRT